MNGEIMKVCTDKQPTFGRFNSDTFHLTANGARTFCGRDASSWLRMGVLEDHELNSAFLCRRCSQRALRQEDAA